jgi:kynureninase
VISRDDIQKLDQADPLAAVRDEFFVPDGLVYLDGNSLGMLPKRVPERLERAIRQEWGTDLIRSWNKNNWIGLPAKVGAKIARLIGAESDEVITADSTSVNLFKLLLAALKLRPDRRVIVSDIDNFPTDLYMAQGVNALLDDRLELRFVKRGELLGEIDSSVAVVMLTQVDYRTGELLDMKGITDAVHAHGALMIWDLAHSAGAFPVDLTACDVDFAVGCGYKYLNGGPGAPAFLYVPRKHQSQAVPVLSGWMGHKNPFEFTPWYAPAEGIGRLTAGTPSVLGLQALDAALEVFDTVNMNAVREKSLGLTDAFIALMEPLCLEFGFELVTPKDHALRGSQVSYAHEQGYAIMQALIADGVIGDFRAPNIVRFGFTPLYTRYADVQEAVTRLERVMREGRWNLEQYRERAAVT